MLLPLSEVRNHTQFCADLGGQVNPFRLSMKVAAF
jgi:hypothetical protein